MIAETIRTELSDIWSGISSSSDCIENMETLFIWEQCANFIGHKSLKYFVDQKGFELRQKRLLKLIKDFDYEIGFYWGKVNIVTDVLSWKTSSSFVQMRMIPTSIQDKLRS